MKKIISSRFFKVYLLPGIIVQSVFIGGGYGTGRELVEYFSKYGPIGGLLGMGVAYICFALIFAATYEFARSFGVYDYRSFFKKLYGLGYILFEIVFILTVILVLAIIGSAAGVMMKENFNIPYTVGIIAMILLVGILSFYGREFLKRVLAYWTYVIYVVIAIFLITVFFTRGGDIVATLGKGGINSGWALGGLKYAWYNVAFAPILLYAITSIKTRREAVSSGFMTPAILLFPALMIHLSLMSSYPEIIEQPLPVYWLIGQLGFTILLIVYMIALLGTFIETGAGLNQGIIERIDNYLIEKNMRPLKNYVRGAISAGGIIIAIVLSRLGIVNLIASGYGALSWVTLFIYIIPLFTYGIYMIVKHKNRETAGTSS